LSLDHSEATHLSLYQI
jgi:hypothetical protein